MSTADQEGRPNLSAGVRLSFDAHRDQWVLLAPERVIVCNVTAKAVLERCNGRHTVEEIVAELASEFAAPVETIAPDIQRLIAQLRARRLVDMNDSAAP